jgi:hypothetical protein
MRKLFDFLGLAAIIFSIALISCEKDENKDTESNKCNVSNPIEDLDWLKQEIDDVKHDEYSYYVMATYEGETVFYYGNCNPLINYISIVRNCNGDSLGFTNDLYDELTDISTLWKHEDSKCNFQD